MALDDDDMTRPPEEPYSEDSMSADEFVDSGNSAESGADGGADGSADAADGDGAGADDPTTASDEDPRFA